jgi:copper transport protein
VRVAAALITLLIALAPSSAALAHASLVRSEPADGAIVTEPPAMLRLTFNEPVTPLVMRIVTPDGTSATPQAVAENSVVVVTPEPLRRGTHVLSWRVISADGHPVGGSLIFSVGEASAQPGLAPPGDPLARGLLWSAKLAIYIGLLLGVGGVFFQSWLAGVRTRWLDRTLLALLGTGLIATPLSLGLHGLDALDLRLAALAQREVWATALATTYGWTAVALEIAFVAGICAVHMSEQASARIFAGLALGTAGFALALSGHAGNASPQLLTRPSVFVHVVCVAFWIGALLPLAASLRAGGGAPIARFTRAIPYPLVGLVISGSILAVAQLDRPDALWTTPYGIVLSCKLGLVVALLSLAAANRYRLVPHFQKRGMAAARPLAASFKAELCIAVAILALVSLWRFTPPPRSLAAAAPIEVHLHGARAMAQLTLTPVRARDPDVHVLVLDGALNPLAVKEVTVTLANAAAGIEPVRRVARLLDAPGWRVDNLRVPVTGQWSVRVDLLVDDFDKIVLEDKVSLPRLP